MNDRELYAAARQEWKARAVVDAFLDALGPSSCAPAPAPVWRSSPASLPAGAVEYFRFSADEKADVEALATRFDRYGPE